MFGSQRDHIDPFLYQRTVEIRYGTLFHFQNDRAIGTAQHVSPPGCFFYNDQHRISDKFYFTQEVRRYKYCFAKITTQVKNKITDISNALRIKSIGRLIEYDQLWIMDKR